MATLRGSGSVYDVGAIPPQVNWTVVRGDTAAFKVYVTDDSQSPINVPDWTIRMQVKRPNSIADKGIITDNATLIFELFPLADIDDLPGEFSVRLQASESVLLETGDIFDIQLSAPNDAIVWTVAQGNIIVLEDVTD